MTNPTSNFGWQMPTASDLVTDLPADFETFGQAVDTSLADLKGGTTGQVLSKATNADMDFTWVTSDDANAIQNAIVDAKGDLIAASAADTPARLAVGNDGETLVADSSTATGLRYQANFAAGKNKIINGDFGIWQRGTTFNSAGSGAFFADRFSCYIAGGTNNITRQTFTAGTAPVAGYEGQYFLRWTNTSAVSGLALGQSIEDVRTFAGQTITVSFWAKCDASMSVPIQVYQVFGSGGSTTVSQASGNLSIGTSWTRFSATFTLGSMSGKTIGTNSYLRIDAGLPNQTFVFDTWGWQVEAGSVPTAFQTATGTIQGELAACRYYYRRTTGDATSLYQIMANTGFSPTTTDIAYPIMFDTPMRTTPSSIEYANLRNSDGINAPVVSSLTINTLLSNRFGIWISVTTSGATQFRPYALQGNNSATAFLGWSAEL